MWKTFKAEFKHIFSSKVKAIEWIVMLFIPFVYGFLYMNAYWTPFKHVDKLDIVAVNLNTDTSNPDVADALIGNMKSRKLNAGEMIINVKVDPLEKIYSQEQIEEAVNAGKYTAAIVIPDGFNKGVAEIKSIISKDISGGNVDVMKILNDITDYYKKPDSIKLQYYNDFKNNYLAGEMTNFGAGLNDLLLQQILSSLTSSTGVSIWSMVEPLVHSMVDKLNIIKHDPINTRIVDKDKNFGYGAGLSPYFISIALWAGTLVMTFMIKNERYIKTQSTLKHYFGKWAVWVFSGLLQATILMTAVTLQGVNLGIDQWQMFFFAYLTVIVFASIVQGVAYSIRFGDLGEFAVVILLVLQLISSSGTFPVEMQWILFKIVHPIAPFTYTVNGFRELLFQPDIANIFINIGWLLLFPIVIMPASIFFNYHFDKRTRKKTKAGYIYQSYEIHMGDM